MNNIVDTLKNVLTNTSLWGAILSTIVIISLGYILVKVKVFKEEWKTPLNSIVLKVALPALALTGFMASCKFEELSQQGIILGVAFGFYIVLIVIAQIWVKLFKKRLPKVVRDVSGPVFQLSKKNSVLLDVTKAISSDQIVGDDLTKRSLVMWMMLIFGSTTFFGMPIIKELYQQEGGVIAANLWNIPYRIFLYSYCFLVMSGLRFNKENVAKSCKTALFNPIVIATFIGLVCWLTQLIPGAAQFGLNFEIVTDKPSGWFQWQVTMPYLYRPLNIIGGLSSPLVWLSIGMTLAGCKLSKSIKDKWVWVFSIQKLILIPLLVFLIMLPLVFYKLVKPEIAISMVIFASTPPATVVIAYSMQYKLCDKFAAECSSLTTLLAIFMLPTWIIISKVVFDILIS